MQVSFGAVAHVSVATRYDTRRLLSKRPVYYILTCRLLVCLMPSITLMPGTFGGKSLFIKRAKRERDNKLKWGEVEREGVREREHEQ